VVKISIDHNEGETADRAFDHIHEKLSVQVRPHLNNVCPIPSFGVEES
jgi:hypothetical protein